MVRAGCLLLVFGFSHCYAPLTQAQDVDESLKRRLQAIHADLEHVRNEVYGNCFFEGSMESQVGDETSVNWFRFWSRENTYFRVDVYGDEDFESVSERLVIRPEGFAKMRDTGKGLAVADWGDAEAGMPRLFGYPFYLASTRAVSIGVENWFATYAGIEGFARAEGVEFDTRASTADADNLVLAVVATTSKSRSETEIALKGPHHVLQKFETTVKVDGKPHSSNLTTYNYSTDLPVPIPTTVTETKTNKAGVTTTTMINVSAIDPTAQPIAVFALDGLGVGVSASSGTWMRRLVILAVGLAMIAVYIVHRRHKSTA